MADGSLMPLPADSISKYVQGSGRRNPTIFSSRATFVSAVDSTGTLTFKSNTNGYGIGLPVKVEPATLYTISGTFTGTASVSVFHYKTNGEYLGGKYEDISGDFSVSFKTSTEAGYAVLSFTAEASASNYVFGSLMLNKGDAAQPFRQYTGIASSSITIGDTTLEINTDFGTAVIDCDRENVTIDGADSNQNVTLTDQYENISEEYLQLAKGNNTVTFTGDITSCSIDPKMWTL